MLQVLLLESKNADAGLRGAQEKPPAPRRYPSGFFSSALLWAKKEPQG